MARSRRAYRALTVLAFVAVLLAPSLAAGAGKEEVVVAQGSPFSFDFTFSPRTLPQSEQAPTKLRLLTRFASPTGSPHPPPASQVTLLLDRFFDLSTRRLPTCSPRLQIMSAPPLPERCKPALVGRGRMEASIAFPEAEELRQRPHLLIYNGGTRAGRTRLWIYARVNFPVPAALLTPIDITRTRQGRYGTKAVLSIAKIAGGSGSIAWISLSFHREYVFKGKRHSVVSARCPDGKLQVAAEASFADGTPATNMEETVRTCTTSG